MANNKLKEALEGMVDKLKNAAVDLTTLDVVTLSGDVKKVLIADNNKAMKVMKPLDIVNGAEGTLVIEAFTHIDFDQDKVQYFKTDLKETDLSYLLHQEAVDASVEARQAFLDFIGALLD
jgi:hypothetical protein